MKPALDNVKRVLDDDDYGATLEGFRAYTVGGYGGGGGGGGGSGNSSSKVLGSSSSSSSSSKTLVNIPRSSSRSIQTQQRAMFNHALCHALCHAPRRPVVT